MSLFPSILGLYLLQTNNYLSFIFFFKFENFIGSLIQRKFAFLKYNTRLIETIRTTVKICMYVAVYHFQHDYIPSQSTDLPSTSFVIEGDKKLVSISIHDRTRKMLSSTLMYAVGDKMREDKDGFRFIGASSLTFSLLQMSVSSL